MITGLIRPVKRGSLGGLISAGDLDECFDCDFVFRDNASLTLNFADQDTADTLNLNFTDQQYAVIDDSSHQYYMALRALVLDSASLKLDFAGQRYGVIGYTEDF